jgi:hypothetical protein
VIKKKDLKRDIKTCGLRKDGRTWRRGTWERKSRWYNRYYMV